LNREIYPCQTFSRSQIVSEDSYVQLARKWNLDHTAEHNENDLDVLTF
jgi:hypothetical protein